MPKTDRLSIKFSDTLIGASDFLSGLSDEERERYDDIFEYMLYKIEDGWFRKIEGLVIGEQREDYLNRLGLECREIYRLGFVKYVLIVWDMCCYGRNKGIPFNARGSANASLALYLLDVTSFDPMTAGPGGDPLIFARFISPNRVDYPDIDLDFADNRRDEIKQYLNDKYGFDCVADIATFGKLKGKQCFRDVCRAYGVPLHEVNKIAPLIIERDKGDEDAELCIRDSFATIPGCMAFKEKYPDVVAQAEKLEGQIKSAGVHASGVVVSDRPLVMDMPIGIKRDGSKIAGFNMKDVESRGLLKLDCLGLRTLHVLADTVAIINRRHDLDICECEGCRQIREVVAEKRDRIARLIDNMGDERWKAKLFARLSEMRPKLDVWLENIRYDDQGVIEDVFKSGYALGIFQFETSMFRKLLKRALPENILDLGDLNALGRPGPMRSGIVEDWLARRKGEEVPEVHPAYDRITKPTQGQIVYQEQMMFIAHDLAGMSWERTDKLRKVCAKSVGKEFLGAEFREEFVKGSVENGLTEKAAGEIFDKIVEFGAYGFNAAHSISYSYFAYRMAWLKHYYPREFILSEVNTLAKEPAKTRNIISEARRRGIAVHLPDINKSSREFALDAIGMRAGFAAIKGIGEVAAANIMEHQPFTDWTDFAKRVPRRKVHIGHVKKLVAAGCFSGMYPNTKYMIDNLQMLMDKPGTIADYTDEPRYDLQEETELQISVLKLPPETDPLTFYTEVYKAIDPLFSITPVEELSTDYSSNCLIVKGVIYGIEFGYKDNDESEESVVKGGATFDIDDGTDFIRVEASPRVYEKYKAFLTEDAEETPVILKGRKRPGMDKIDLEDITSLADFRAHLREPVTVIEEDLFAAEGEGPLSIENLSSFEKFLLDPPIKHYEHLKEALRLQSIDRVISDATIAESDRQFRFLGMVTNIYEHQSKNGLMSFVTVDDLSAQAELLIWAEAWAPVKKKIAIGDAIVVKARKLPPRGREKTIKLQVSARDGDKIMTVEELLNMKGSK